LKEGSRVNRFQAMETADDAQIVSELQGEGLGALVYEVEGRPWLSYAGVRYAASRVGGLHITEVGCVYNAALDQYEATVLAVNEASNVTLPGSAEQPHKLDSGSVDVFARRKAISKATRNALLALMPEDHIQTVIREVQHKDCAQELAEPEPVETPSIVDSESVKDYLGKHGFPVDSLVVSEKESKIVIKSTRFLSSSDWCGIDHALRTISDSSWIRGGNRWEIQT